MLEIKWYEHLALARDKTVTSGDCHVTSQMLSDVAAAAKENDRVIMEEDPKWGPP